MSIDLISKVQKRTNVCEIKVGSNFDQIFRSIGPDVQLYLLPQESIVS